MRATQLLGVLAWLCASLSFHPGVAAAGPVCPAVSQLEEMISIWEHEKAIHPERLEALRGALSEVKECLGVETGEEPSPDEPLVPSEPANEEAGVEAPEELQGQENPGEPSKEPEESPPEPDDQPPEEEAVAVDFTGTWATYFGNMVLNQSGERVTGTYDNNRGRIHGEVSNRTFRGKWLEAPSYSEPADGGDIEFELSRDGLTFTGRWRTGSQGEWFEGLDGRKKSLTPR